MTAGCVGRITHRGRGSAVTWPYLVHTAACRLTPSVDARRRMRSFRL